MQKIDIINKIKQFKENRKDRYSIIKIGVFGSFARDRVTPESDVDIVVLLADQDLFNLIGIKQDLEEELQLPVDVVSYRKKMNPFLKRRIDSEAVYV
jgi:predicted nucleotidyltransferase